MQRVQTMLNEYRNLAQDHYDKLPKKLQNVYSVYEITIELLENDTILYPENLFEKAKKENKLILEWHVI